jgi:hypothetical protein
VSSGFLHPPGRTGIADQIKEPEKQRRAVSAPEPEPRRVGRQSVRDRARVVMARPDGVSHQVGHRLGILPVIQKVGGDPRWPGDGQSADHGPLTVVNGPLVKPDVRPARLPPDASARGGAASAPRSHRWLAALLASYSLEGVGYIIAGTFLVAAIEFPGSGRATSRSAGAGWRIS